MPKWPRPDACKRTPSLGTLRGAVFLLPVLPFLTLPMATGTRQKSVIACLRDNKILFNDLKNKGKP
jgi:hypothetical protein